MKIKYYLSFIILLSIGCVAQQNQEMSYSAITYTASSRGLFEDIEITSQKISILKNRSSKSRSEASIPEEEWGAILKMCKALPKNVAPLDPDKLAVDAAIKGVLTLKRSSEADGTIFVIDHSNVPKEMRPLIDKIKALANTVE